MKQNYTKQIPLYWRLNFIQMKRNMQQIQSQKLASLAKFQLLCNRWSLQTADEVNFWATAVYIMPFPCVKYVHLYLW